MLVDSSRAERARARAGWPGRVTTLDDQDDAAIVRGHTASERIAMVHRVTLDAWAATRRSIPQYSRSEMPGRVIRARDGG
jgi:hypothetical protein